MVSTSVDGIQMNRNNHILHFRDFQHTYGIVAQLNNKSIRSPQVSQYFRKAIVLRHDFPRLDVHANNTSGLYAAVGSLRQSASPLSYLR
jgi:hypothetical protein